MGSECARPVEALAGESSIGGERGLADLHCFQGVLVRGMGGGVGWGRVDDEAVCWEHARHSRSVSYKHHNVFTTKSILNTQNFSAGKWCEQEPGSEPCAQHLT